MGFIKNLFTFDKIEKINSGYAIGHYRKIDDKALLYNGEIVVPNISDVSINMRVESDKSSNKIFFAKKTKGGCSVLNDKGEVIFASLNNAVRSKQLKKEVFVVDEEKKVEIVHYIMETENGKVLMIPQVGYVSAECKEIGEMDSLGRRRVTEFDLPSVWTSHFVKGVSYYINPLGSIISPEILSEVDAGEYKICFVEDERGVLLDYIYDKNFVQLSEGYSFINYVNGRFFAKDGRNRNYLIDEKGRKLYSGLSSYHVLKNGVLVGVHGLNAGKAVVLDSENNEIYNLENPVVDANVGVVSGIDCSNDERRCYMFGLNRARTFLVNPACAELMIKILKGDKLSTDKVVALLTDVTNEDLDQTISCYEWIVKDNLKRDPDNETLKNLKKTARETFLNELLVAAREFKEKVNNGINARRLAHIKQFKFFEQNVEEIQNIEEESAKE